LIIAITTGIIQDGIPKEKGQKVQGQLGLNAGPKRLQGISDLS